ncbi:uncharacterized protein DDB_G0283357 [Lucilia sericata]|uniref:uncharacterized protein DDB_G0283357 n=1 Tax=Lucilia sericata TaxID=13632 RepID=UPI0018A7F48A|nr:uncharacterized protein DDB_G0283357 [Lucilia sericata]
MSLKRFAMLAAISYQNQQNYNNNNNNNSNNTNYYNNNNNNNSTYNKNETQTTFATTTTTESATTKIINSNKSTLIQLKQQQQQQSQQIIAATTSKSSSLTPSIHHNDKANATTSIHRNDNHHHETDDTSNGISDDDSSSNYSSESSEILDFSQHSLPPERQPSNTYTSTTYYGSGFGVFHQQNIRSNGGGIALITGSSSSNGLGSGSYSNGINNNVNLLLGGAMLTLITTILCVVCYCCHRNIKKRTEAAYRQQRQWLENDPNMEIYSVEQCYETSGLFVGDSMDGLATIPALHHEPPPSYDAVVAMQEQQQLLIQQHQQQLLMQQQLLQQQLPTNNSPPPGYRSSLDVSSIIQGRVNALGGVLGVGGSIISGMEINSLASSDANIRTATSHSPIDPLLNYNDVNGNMANALTVATTTPTNNRATVSYLRNKQQQQQQRNVGPNQLSQLNMKKVLQAQSCCSLQRAEVENMWNAAAAALAARSAHLPSESRASTTASTSSPTLAMNARKLSQGYNTSKSNTPETFGSRYLKQNYYRRGCPLCGKFRYDNDSILSISMESNLDTLAGALAEEQAATNGQEGSSESTQNSLNNNDNLTNNLHEKQQNANECTNETDDIEEADIEDEVDDNDNDIEQQCSCANTKRKFKQQNHYQKVNTQQDNTEEIEESLQQVEITVPELIPNREEATATANMPTADANANCAIATARQSTYQDPSNHNNNNNNDNDILEDSLPSTSAATAVTTPHIVASTSSDASTPTSVTINLDCINENGIISLDMSKIIDKTGLPTYDAALKLESSGYV